MKLNYLYIGGAAILAIGGYFVLTRSSASPVENVQSEPTPLLYASGFGTTATSSNSTPGATTDVNSQLSSIMSAIQGQSANDMAASLASTAAQKDIALAGIASDTQLGLANTNLGFMDLFMGSLKDLKKMGISQINGAGGLGAGLVYTDPKKNLSYATGFDANGNLIGENAAGQQMLLQQSAQQAYDNSIVSGVDGFYYQGNSGTTIGTKPTNPRVVTPTRNPRAIPVPNPTPVPA